MKFSVEQIDSFIETVGMARQKFSLKWSGKDSFFDKDVQKIMLQRHPANFSYQDRKTISPRPVCFEFPRDATEAYPVETWTLLDQLAAHGVGPTRLDECLIIDRVWRSNLHNALVAFHARPKDSLPERISHWLDEWSLTHFTRIPRDRDIRPLADPEQEDGLTMPDGTLLPKGQRGASPLPIKRADGLKPAKYLEGCDYSETPGAITKHVHDENKRRDKVMRTWAECWLARMGVQEIKP